jgi:hypothetical protein
MDYFPRKSLSKYLITDTIDFNKHVHLKVVSGLILEGDSGGEVTL